MPHQYSHSRDSKSSTSSSGSEHLESSMTSEENCERRVENLKNPTSCFEIVTGPFRDQIFNDFVDESEKPREVVTCKAKYPRSCSNCSYHTKNLANTSEFMKPPVLSK